MVTSGLRIGTAALAARGFDVAELGEVADVIVGTLGPTPDFASLSGQVRELATRHPLYTQLGSPRA